MIIRRDHALGTQRTLRRPPRWAGAVLLILCSICAPAWAQTKTCGTPGKPACPGPAPVTTAWQYYQTAYANGTGPYNSLASYETGYLAQINAATGCSGAYFNSVVDPYGPAINSWVGIDLQFYLLPTYTQILNAPACDFPATNTVYNSSYKIRSAYCPTASGTVSYQAGPPIVGPTCDLTPPLTPTLPVPPKAMGAICPLTSSSLLKGNPCDVSSGNKYQAELDYRGAGTNALQFVRSYNSLASAWAPLLAVFPKPLGLTWTGTYFQSVAAASVTDSSGTHTTLYALRPDGRVLTFTLYLGAYVPDADVADTLVATAGGFQYQTADDTIEVYNAAGALQSVTPRGSSTQTVNYAGGASYPSSVTDAFGHTLSFLYAVVGDGQLHLTTLTDPSGATVTYAYGANGTLGSATYQDTSVRGYGYGASGAASSLTSLTDESTVVYATWTYAAGGSQVLSSAHAAGADSYTFTYPFRDVIRTVTDPLGVTRTYNEQLVQNLYRTTSASSICAGCGEDASRTMDANGNVATRMDFKGVQTTYSYDLDRNLETSRTEAFGTVRARTITTTWHTTYRVPLLISVYAGGTATGTPLRTTGFTYDTLGNALTKTVSDPAASTSRTWTYTYSSYGQMLTADGPRTDAVDKTTYTYYTCSTGFQCGQVNTVSNALSQVTTYNTYNAHGQPLTITDPNSVVTTLVYDARQRLTSRQVGTETTTFTYWPTGLLKKVTLPDTSYIQYTYDAAHRLTTIADSLGNSIVYTLDAMGNRTAENAYDATSFLHRTHAQVFNTLNQLYKDINAAGTAAVTTQYGYDNNGNQTSIAAPLARNTANTYDELNRLNQITDPANGITQFGYDANDNLLSVKDPRNLTTSYVYNGFGDVKTQTSPDTATTTNTYDSGGNLKTSTDARTAISTYTYDALNRVSTVAYKIGTTTDQTLTFTYDTNTNGVGRLRSAADASQSTSWTYDTQGRVIGKGQTIGTATKSVGYAYINGNLTTLTTPSGQSVTYGYNSNHQVTSVAVNGTTILNNVTYEPFGAVHGWTWGNATTSSRSYDTDGRISQIAHIETSNYGYDDASRITTLANVTNSTLNWTYGYDLLDRLTSAVQSGSTYGFTYDANGNRLTQTGTFPWTLTPSTTSNRLASTSGAGVRTYSYDAAGDVLTDSAHTFAYNNRGRTKTGKATSTTTTYVLNALGQRIKKSGGVAGTVLYLYDEAGHLLGEYTSTGALTQETVWLGDIPVATLRPNGSAITIYYVHADHLNTPKIVTRPSDNKQAWRWDQDPFGTQITAQNPQGLGTFVFNLRYPGQYFDSETGTFQNYFRDYDPQVGRYVESDPIGLQAGVNTYTYVSDNPLSRTDPSGLAPNPAEAACVGGPNPVCVGGLVVDVITTVAGMGILAEIADLSKERKARETATTQAPNCPSNNDNGCERDQRNLLIRQARLVTLKAIMSDFQYAYAVRAFNSDAKTHNSRCRSNQVSLVKLN